jgi:hypothetical protein
VNIAKVMRLVGVVLLATANACYSPQLRDCVFSCGEQDRCPEGLTCASDGWCRVDALSPACPCICDPVQQTCCTSSDACDLLAPTYAPVCRSVEVANGQGIKCKTQEECDHAFTCVFDEGQTLGSCHRFCDTASDCTGSGGLCTDIVGPIQTCSTSCNPLDAAGCASEFTCEIFWEGNGGGLAWTDCHFHGGGDAGSSCASDADCKRPTFCRGAPAGTCTRYCTMDNPNCSAPLQCRPLDQDKVIIDGVEWGYCGN